MFNVIVKCEDIITKRNREIKKKYLRAEANQRDNVFKSHHGK